MKVKVNTENIKGNFIFYGNRRVYHGEVIELESSKHFTKNCMEKVSKPRKVVEEKVQEPKESE